MNRLADRVYVVSGAAGGIGSAICRSIAAEVGHVVLTDLPGEQLEHAAAQVREAGGGQVLAVGADVSDVSAITRLVDQAASHFGRLDGCVASAGVIKFCSILEWPSLLKRWREHHAR